MQASLASSSKAQYERSWSKLVGFFQSLGCVPKLPVSVAMMLLFVAHLHNAGYAPSSIISTISAISYFHKVNGLHDPARNFVVGRVLLGAQKLRSRPDVRLPITLPILAHLIRALPQVLSSHYKCVMLRAMMVLAFKAYLRVGEMVPRASRAEQGCLFLRDVAVNGDVITVSFRQFKHSCSQGPQSLQVNGQCIGGTSIYPATFLREFLHVRGPRQAILFAYADGSPMLRREFDAILKRLLEFCGLSTKVFKGHSFRIGAATSAALRGESDAQIRAAGRWASDAFRRYIRIS